VDLPKVRQIGGAGAEGDHSFKVYIEEMVVRERNGNF